MTEQHMARRTLVKSPPELWAQCSDAASLARHLGQFGEIRITRLEPETTVAWEGEDASGTVRLEPSGWGTQVTLTAETAAEVVEEVVDAVVVEEPEPEVVVEEPEVAVVEEEPEAGVLVEEEARPEPESVATGPEAEVAAVEPEPVAVEPGPETGAAPRASFFARLRLLFRVPPREELIAAKDEDGDEDEVGVGVEVAVAEPAPVVESQPEPEPVAVESEPVAVEPEPVAVEAEPKQTSETKAALVAALDSLGQAHHRPFSRA
ncbi:MAG TPA: hypothetical protein VGF93_02570 [Solirubrobacteraceae bacterium]